MDTSGRERLTTAALAVSFGLLVLVGLAGPSAAKPPLADRGWAPGTLPWSPGPATVTGLLWAAYVVGALGVLLRLRSAGEVPSGPARWTSGWAPPALLALTALLTGPFGSADHTNYAAYGRIAALGGDPYLTPPSGWSPADPVISLVEPPWTHTVSIYGPVATLLQEAASQLGGASQRQTVWFWQLFVVLAWLSVRALLVTAGASRRRVDTLWTFNPLVFGIAVLGAHVDLVAAALALGALAAARRSPLAAGVLAGLATSCKVTYGVVAVAVLVAWSTQRGRGTLRRGLVCVLGGLVVAVPLHAWAGPHVFDQLDRARRSISLASPWRLLYELLSDPLGGGPARTVVTAASALLMVAFVVLLTRLTAPDRGAPSATTPAPASVTLAAARWALVLTTAYTLAAPYTLPWYDVLIWATLPMLAPSRLDSLLLVRFAAMALAYVPGRVVGMTPRVQDVTLAVRRRVVPYAVLLVWVWLTAAATRGWRPPSGPRPPARGRSPR